MKNTEIPVRTTLDVPCGACGRSGAMRIWRAREMMFGLRKPFSYGECGDCGSLQLLDPPDDPEPYYPPHYYSFRRDPEVLHSGLRGLLRRARNPYPLSGRGFGSRILHRLFPYPYGDLARWMRKAGVQKESAILDVGSGSGELPYDLVQSGFHGTLGIDRFAGGDRIYANGARVMRAGIEELEGRTFRLVMFHHVLEHVPDPLATLRTAAGLLEEGGGLLVRVPTVSSLAWERYRTDWVQLDAPRHLHLFSVEGLRQLGRRAGLHLREVVWDSTSLQFEGSEMYQRDIPLSRIGREYGPLRRWLWSRQARRLNREGRGDQAIFWFSQSAP